MDWQLVIVILILVMATSVIVKTFCFGNKDHKCHNCSVKCSNDSSTKSIIWLKKGGQDA